MVCLIASNAAAQDISKGRWVDLTHSFNERTVYWPTAKTFSKTEVFKGMTPGGWFYSAYNFAAAEHGGTHMDSPIHFADRTRPTDKVPLDQLIGPGFVIDVSQQSKANVDYLVRVHDIRTFEAKHGRLPQGAIVLLNTGRAKLYPDRKSYMGTDERGQEAVAKLHFPGLSEPAASLLVARKIGAVGIDTPSIDRGQSKTFTAHVRLMMNNIPAFENVADMDGLPPTGTTIIALPMKIQGGSGGPLRIVAHLPETRE
ncbi:MAG: cyclase family protein [Hyphomicrobiaceae bacterium]